MELPIHLKYSEDHLWIRVEGNRAVIGVTDFVQEELGMIVFVELPQIGDELKKGDPFGSMESVKTVTEFYSPVSGKVADVNQALVRNPSAVNLSPYGEGWVMAIDMTDPDELDGLWSAERYQDMYGHE